ncbi:uncharacterized protein isoform X2 [Rhodnius prolixus]
MDDSGTPINKGPTIGTRDVDLYKLFKVVQNQGGYNRVTNHNNWKLVALKMGFGQNPITVNLVKIAYKKFLFTFEEFYRKLGCTLLNHPSRLSRSCCRGGRNLIRNKDSGSSSGSLAKTDSKRQVKDGKSQSELSTGKIKTDKDEYPNQAHNQDDDIYLDIPSDGMSKSPTPPPSTSNTILHRAKRGAVSVAVIGPQSPTLKVHLPIKIKVEQEGSQPSTASQAAATPPSSPTTRSGSLSPTSGGLLQASRPDSPALQAQIISAQQQSQSGQKKESRSRQIKKSTNVDNISSSSSNISKDVDSIASDIDINAAVPHLKEKKRRAAFPRAVVAAKRVKQQLAPRIASPHAPGLATSRTKRTVNKDKLRTIVKNLKSKWVPSSVPATTNQELTKVPVKSKSAKEDGATTIKSRKDDLQSQSVVCLDDKKKGGRKRRDKRLSEDRFIALPSYKTILPGDKLRVYYGPTLESKVTYEAKVLSIRTEGNESVYLVHYTGWNNRYDEWIKTSRIADNLSWIPGRTARKANQTPKTPKRKGGHKNDTGSFSVKDQQVSITATSSSSASSTSSNSSATISKSNTTSLMSSGCRKTTTRASTRAAAIKKETPTTETDSDTNTESDVNKKTLLESNLNDDSGDKKSLTKKRKFEEISKSDLNLPIKLEIEDDFDEESSSLIASRNMEKDDVLDRSLGDNQMHDVTILKSVDIKKEMELHDSDSQNVTTNLGNVIIVDAELKNESEEDSLVIDENQEVDESEVIEGYSSVASIESKSDKPLTANQTGRDFDLTQIRSELKGIDTTVSRQDHIEELNMEDENTLDIYEFKEPEFETASTPSKLEDKNKSRSNLVVRMFSDVMNTAGSQKESVQEESNIHFEESNSGATTYSAQNTSAESLSDERPIIKTCEEAFDRVCAEPLRAATERPPAGFLFMDEDEEEEDVYDDDDSQDRLIISERDSDTEIPAQVAMDLTPTELNQQPSTSMQKDELETKGMSTLDAEYDKEVISREDDEEDLEDELLNVAIQRAIESSEDTTDGEILSRHLAPRHMFAVDTFSPVLNADNKKINTDNDNIIKISMVASNHESINNVTEKEQIVATADESQLLEQNAALDLSNATEEMQDGVELLSQDMDMVSEDEVVSQEDAAEPESMVENLDMEDAVGDDEEDEDDDLITVEENVSSSQGMSSDCSGTGRGPHTPPGPAPGSPPDTELEQDFSEQYSAGTDLEQQFEELAEQVERDEQPPLLTREVEVVETEERQEADHQEIACQDEDNDETNLVSLLCEETIPGSPQTASYHLSPEPNDEESVNYSEVASSKQLADNVTTDNKNIQKEPQEFAEDAADTSNHGPEIIDTNSTQIASRSLQQHTAPVSQTPVPSPTSSLSSNNSPSRETILSPHDEGIQVQTAAVTEQYQGVCAGAQTNTSDETAMQPSGSESVRTRKSDARSASSKKNRRTRKRSEEVAKRKYRARHHGSDSDEHCESSNRGYQRRSRTPPRLRKYCFTVQLSPEMDHQQRVYRIQNAMADIRKAYASLKLELASIERRRKKLRRREREYRL